MERYKRKFKEEDSLSELKDPAIVDKIVEFIRANPFPKDHSQVHTFAEGLGLEANIVEQYVDAMLTVILCGGKSKGKEADANGENKEIGKKIEVEHVEMDNDNAVVKKIQDVFIDKIKNDHLFENKEYYKSNINFQDELKQEGK